MVYSHEQRMDSLGICAERLRIFDEKGSCRNYRLRSDIGNPH